MYISRDDNAGCEALERWFFGLRMGTKGFTHPAIYRTHGRDDGPKKKAPLPGAGRLLVVI